MNTDLTLNWATDSACGGRVFRVHKIVPSFFSKAADWSGPSKCWEMLKKKPTINILQKPIVLIFVSKKKEFKFYNI